MAEENEKTKKINQKIVIPAVLIIILIGLGAVFSMKYINNTNKYIADLKESSGLKSEANVFMSDEDAEEYKKDKVPHITVSMYNKMRCYKDDDGKWRARVGVKNKNDHQIIVQFSLAETDEVIYTTGLIPPGGELVEVQLDVEDLKPGIYSVNAIYSAVSEEDNQTNLGSTGINVDMIVD